MSHRFHIETVPEGGRVTLPREVARHLNVLKVAPGDEVTLFDGTGREARARVERVGPDGVEALILARNEVSREGTLALTLACAVPKGRRMDTLVRMVAELGVAELVPLVTARSIVKPRGVNKLDRWRTICVAASEQSGRNVVMTVTDAVTLPEVLERAEALDFAVILSPDANAPSLPALLASRRDARSLLILIGPEGGFTDAELSAACGAGALPARLTRSILRIETAAVAAAAIVMTHTQDNQRLFRIDAS